MSNLVASSAKLYASAGEFIQPGAFFQLPTAYVSALASAAISHAEFRVLCALARFRNTKTGKCNPARGRLEAATGMPETSISRATSSLQSKGWLTKHLSQDRRKVEQYDLLIPQHGGTPRAAKSERPSKDARATPVRGPAHAAKPSIGGRSDMPDMGDLM